MAGPLSGIRVIDLSQMATGPLATAQLADQGADVVKVEPPGLGDALRSFPSYSKGGLSAFIVSCNRGKRSLCVDLSIPDGVALVRRLIDGADVFVQNFRPGVVERMGLDPADLRASDPRLVTASISGYGRKGEMAGRPVYDPVIQALTGYVATQVNPEIPFPDLVRHAVVDKATAAYAAQAITAALFRRERDGVGQHIDLSMVDAALGFLWPDAMMAETLLDDDVELGPALSELYSLTGCADGQIVYWAGNKAQRRDLFIALGHPEWNDDDRFNTKAAANRPENREALGRLLADAFAKLTVDDALTALADADVPCGPITALDEIAALDPVVANDSLVEFEHPVAGRVRQPRPAARFATTPNEPARGAPTVGQHSDEILLEAGFSEAEIGGFRADGVVY